MRLKEVERGDHPIKRWLYKLIESVILKAKIPEPVRLIIALPKIGIPLAHLSNHALRDQAHWSVRQREQFSIHVSTLAGCQF